MPSSRAHSAATPGSSGTTPPAASARARNSSTASVRVETRQLVDPLVGRAQPRAAGRHHGEPRAVVQEPPDAALDGRDQVLAVVEHQHAVGPAQHGGEGVLDRVPGMLDHADGRRDRRHHGPRVRDLAEVDEPPPVGPPLGHPLDRVRRQPGLAHAAGARSRSPSGAGPADRRAPPSPPRGPGTRHPPSATGRAAGDPAGRAPRPAGPRHAGLPPRACGSATTRATRPCAPRGTGGSAISALVRCPGQQAEHVVLPVGHPRHSAPSAWSPSSVSAVLEVS